MIPTKLWRSFEQDEETSRIRTPFFHDPLDIGVNQRWPFIDG